MKCSKRNCQNIGKYIFSKYKNQIYYYCEQHYRFKEMSNFANKNHNIKLTSAEIEKI